jgi:signal peptidase I
VTTIIAGERRASGRHRKEPDRRGAGAAGGAVLLARRAGLVLALTAVALLILAHLLGWSAMIVRSGSMEPAVPVGSLVLVRPVSGQDVRVGDAIAVRRSRSARPVTVLHRVVALDERDGRRFAELKGDANPTPDSEPVALTEPVARLVAVVPGAGYALATVRTALHPSRLLLLGCGAVGLWLIWGTGRNRRGSIHARSRRRVE